ncbi:S41 family peptidase [Christiangramia echinicola]|uniref:C-terminal processing protease CtpA/Prc, contains a PDZ domain n=1 Tax=Christiangramia echinicola TaxID=279359 RepID=A0A1H1KSX4_9FLAO|nr:S41 family peptidase [Christiangramia echinicola]SDR65120.1 C-terminal processing protease CtpA/Prc, contains a PDZ domain [Christiangramia echinicola]
MKIYKFLLLTILSFGLFTSCSDDDSPGPKSTELPGEEPNSSVQLEVKDFVWKAMNNIYVYKSDVPVLGDSYFSTQNELNDYLEDWDSPEDLFYEGLRSDQDRFSWVVDDYEILESQLQATNKSAGFKYDWARVPNSDTRLVAFVVYVSPNGPADQAGLKRGDYITEVNGQTITIDNYRNGIFNPDNLNLGLSVIEEGQAVSSGDPISITKNVFKEETIPVKKVFTQDGVKIGYILLSTFLGERGVDDARLNDVFGEFKSENIEELIVDVRYNQGGWSDFSSDLGSMVTGQFENKIFTKQQWNDTYQTYFEEENPERLVSRFDSKVINGDEINSLNLNKVYVIATGRSYSASESFIIGLEPYIDVIHIGTATGGKFQGSVTMYDGDNFGKTNINTNHKYAIQPLVYKYANANGYTDFVNGLEPDVIIEEYPSTLGQLGDLDEPLLSEAISQITGVRSQIPEEINRWESGNLKVESEKGYFIHSPEPFNGLSRKKSIFIK